MDRISIIHTLKTRVPAVTVLTALGALVALFSLHMASRRFLLAGLAFSLMLFAGPDDFRWLHYLPFIKQIQTFRCTYLIEFFAFGLIGVGVEAVFRRCFYFIRGRAPFVRSPLLAAWLLVFFFFAGLCGNEIVLLGQKHLVIRNPKNLDAMIDAMSKLENRGFPFRTAPVYKGRYKLRHGWFAIHGYIPYCTHWKGIGPTAAYHLCLSLASASKNNDLHALAGIRYFSGHRNKINRLAEATDRDGDLLFERLPNGPDRHGNSNGWHFMLDSGRDHFLRPVVGSPLPVVCSHKQWIWLTHSWTKQNLRWLWEPTTGFPMRLPPGSLLRSGLMESARAVLYLDHTHIDQDRSALADYTANGGVVISPIPIPGIPTVSPKKDQTVWSVLPASFKRPSGTRPEKNHREEQDPGFENVWVQPLKNPAHSTQRFAFDVDALQPSIVILPMEAASGWQTTLNGRPLMTFPTGPDLVGAYLPKGAHRLVFTWQTPLFFAISLWITLGAVAAVFAIWSVALMRRIKRAVP